LTQFAIEPAENFSTEQFLIQYSLFKNQNISQQFVNFNEILQQENVKTWCFITAALVLFNGIDVLHFIMVFLLPLLHIVEY